MINPKLRWPIEIRLEQVGQDQVLYMNCPHGLSPQPLVLVRAIAPVVGAIDGTKSVDQILKQFEAVGLSKEMLEQLISLLDQHYFLENDRSREQLKANIQGFKAAPVRQAALAGHVYPASKLELEGEIKRWLESGTAKVKLPNKRLIGLIAPHIDYRRGGKVYGEAYRSLEAEDHDLFVLIGTSHQYSDRLFHLTAKDFETPLGRSACDKPFVEKLAGLFGAERAYADEHLHRKEHSLELQLPFLSLLKPKTKIAPILVGSFHQLLQSNAEPQANSEYNDFVSALTETVGTTIKGGSRVCFVLGIDMAHFGKQFGDQRELTTDSLSQVRSRDEQYLAALVSGNKQAVWNHLAEDGDARKICGFPTVYTVLDVFDRLGIKFEGKIFDYRQAVDVPAGCAVTFASVGMYQ